MNDAPEKFYLLPNGLISYFRNADEDVEYIRTDAFIEKAEEYLYHQLNEGNLECGDIETFIENFKKYMGRYC